MLNNIIQTLKTNNHIIKNNMSKFKNILNNPINWYKYVQINNNKN